MIAAIGPRFDVNPPRLIILSAPPGGLGITEPAVVLRPAQLSDFDFINGLILAEAATGHFNPKILEPQHVKAWHNELRSILERNRRPNDTFACALVWENEGVAVGFTIMTAGPDNKGNELYMTAITPARRGEGHGKAMLNAVLRPFRGKKYLLVARCNPPSNAMYQLLTDHGFHLMLTDPAGCRVMRYVG